MERKARVKCIKAGTREDSVGFGWERFRDFMYSENYLTFTAELEGKSPWYKCKENGAFYHENWIDFGDDDTLFQFD